MYRLAVTTEASAQEQQEIGKVCVHPSFIFDKLFKSTKAGCPRCGFSPADHLHMLWSCPELEHLWREVVDIINRVYSVKVSLSPFVCVLGYVEDVSEEDCTRVAVARMLFMVRKVIAQHWLDVSAPSIAEYVNKINWLVETERGIYLKRGAIGKFEKLWARWIDDSGLASRTLMRFRLGLV